LRKSISRDKIDVGRKKSKNFLEKFEEIFTKNHNFDEQKRLKLEPKATKTQNKSSST